jgi:hypothetical protein
MRSVIRFNQFAYRDKKVVSVFVRFRAPLHSTFFKFTHIHQIKAVDGDDGGNFFTITVKRYTSRVEQDLMKCFQVLPYNFTNLSL